MRDRRGNNLAKKTLQIALLYASKFNARATYLSGQRPGYGSRLYIQPSRYTTNPEIDRTLSNGASPLECHTCWSYQTSRLQYADGQA